MTARGKSSPRASYTQRRILENARAGRRLDQGRELTQSAAAGWGCSITSCCRHGWLDREHQLTAAGLAELERLELQAAKRQGAAIAAGLAALHEGARRAGVKLGGKQ